jgi:exopolyphosphatase/guanosine-5'-triphosphate,3'-diphosphate pyrophosphatase
MTPMLVIAAIDIGTHSTHMVVARITPSGFEVITREKSQTRLGEGGGDMKELSSSAMDRGITALRHMKKIADVHSAHVVAVATSAVREANNADEFVTRARREAGIDVEIISGLEEARLIHSAVLRALPLAGVESLLIDIGGGSTEVVVFTSTTEHFARSFKLGSVRLTHRFFPEPHVSTTQLLEARHFIASSIEPARKGIRRRNPHKVIVTSGTGETLARMCSFLSSGEAPRSMNGATFTLQQLQIVLRTIADAPDIEARSEIPGIDSTRADIILAGAIILEELALALDISEFTYCDFALREGLLFNEMTRLSPGGVDDIRHVALASATKLAVRCDDDFPHAQSLARLACTLFDQLSKHFELDKNDRLYLEAASLLANVGIMVSHAKHHLHSYYIIRHADLLGLTDDEIEIIAQIARYHRKGEPKLSHEPFRMLSGDDQRKVRLLSSILRVAIGLDRTHDGRVDNVKVTVSKDDITITISSSQKVDIDLNVYAANERVLLLAEVFDHDVVVVGK